MSDDPRPVPRVARLISILLALVPPARMAWIVFTYGENNLSNDYLFRVPLVAAMLDGRCSLSAFGRWAWNPGGHSMLVLFPVYWFSARFFAWDVRVELALGLLIAAATLALVASTLAARMRCVLLPLLSLLLFSTTKVTSLTFGESSLQMGLAQLGVATAAFGLANRRDRPVVLAAFAAAGGVLASWSWGGGVMAWPLLVAVFALRHERRRATWGLLAAGAAAGLAQYVWLFRPGLDGVPPAPFSWEAKARLVLDLLGRPIANGIGHPDPSLRAQLTGAVGLMALALVVFLLRASLRTQPAALFLAAWTVLVASQIAFVRTAVAPWYASPMALFWVGLVLLLAAAPPPVRTGGILTVALLTLAVQPTWEDKSFYLPSRAPVSAACLREWRTAPAACHPRVFQWGDEGRLGELAALGEPLERRGLSVFGPRRTYLLQGDAALGRVGLEPPGAPSFLKADGRTPADLNDFHRVDLVLAAGSALTWRVDLPSSLTSARFKTRVHPGLSDHGPARDACVRIAGETGAATATARPGRRTPLTLDLRGYAGRTVTLRLTGDDSTGGAPLVFETPRIEIAGAVTDTVR